MLQKIRIAVASLAIMMLCLISSSSTLSYFTDTDSKENIFLVGNASTALTIYDELSPNRELNASNYTLTNNLEIPLYLTATNDGNIPVYQRFRIVMPKDLGGIVTFTLSDTTNYTVSHSTNDTYSEYYIVSNNILGVGNSTVEMTAGTKLKIGDISGLSNLFVCNGDANNCTLGIRFYSDAIQTTGFNNADEAFSNFNETY